MEELEIELKIQTEKRNNKQCEIADLFHCRWPSDEEFISIKTMVDEILIIQAKIGVVRDCLNAIKSNADEIVTAINETEN